MADALHPQPKPTRVERALKAWQASVDARQPPEDSPNRVMEAMMGQRSVTDADGTRRFITPDDELEHLRLWTVFEAARVFPLLELCTVFDIQKPLHKREMHVWELRARVDLRHIHPRKPEFTASLGLDVRDMLRARDPEQWFQYAQLTVREWLRSAEFQLVEALDEGR